MSNNSTSPPCTTLSDEEPEIAQSVKSHDPFYCTSSGAAYQGNSLDLLQDLEPGSVDLVITSPPFALRRSKEYDNKTPEEYNAWFKNFAEEVYRVLPEHGSFVIDIGGGWKKGEPVRSLYHFELLTDLASTKDDGKFYLAQDFYWHNPAKLPTPAQWVTIERIRVTDSVNHVWWLSKTERPKADNKRVLQEYSEAMEHLLQNGYNAGERPGEHDIKKGTFDNPKENGSIPKTGKDYEIEMDPDELRYIADLLEVNEETDSIDNWLEYANTASNTHYLRACREAGIDAHPARFPRQLPHFFIQLLTEPGDTVLDIFAGSNATGRMAENLNRNWLAFEYQKKYLQSSKLRFMTIDDIKEGTLWEEAAEISKKPP